jgi:hypothetical protein
LVCLDCRVARFFDGTKNQNSEKIYQTTTKLPNGNKICPVALKYYKLQENIPTFSIPRPSKINPKWILGYLVTLEEAFSYNKKC